MEGDWNTNYVNFIGSTAGIFFFFFILNRHDNRIWALNKKERATQREKKNVIHKYYIHYV